MRVTRDAKIIDLRRDGQTYVQISSIVGVPKFQVACALEADGTVWCWGSNGAGQTGSGTLAYVSSPVQVPGLIGMQGVSAGWSTACAWKSGSAWCWGSNGYGERGIYGEHDPRAVADLTDVAQPPTASALPAEAPGFAQARRFPASARMTPAIAMSPAPIFSSLRTKVSVWPRSPAVSAAGSSRPPRGA